MAERLNANWACLVNCLGDEGRSAAAELLSGIVTALSSYEIDELSVCLPPYMVAVEALYNLSMLATPTHSANWQANKGGGLQLCRPLAGGQQVL